VTALGLEYYFEATDVEGLKARKPPFPGVYSIHIATSGVTNLNAQPSGTEQTAYRLISVPLDLDDKSPKAVLEDELGPYNIKKWRFYEFLADQTYAEFPNTSEMTSGKAFWFIVKEPGKRISTGAGKTNLTSEPYVIPLHERWNYIANPFNFPTFAVDTLSNGNSFMLFSFDGKWSDPVEPKNIELQPFEGYAVFSASACSMFVNPYRSSSLNNLAKEKTVVDKREILWSIRILAQCQEARDDNNVLKVIPGASQHWDKMDYPEPPVIGEYVSVYFPHPEWERLVSKYCTDARPQSSDGEIWDFEVTTNIRDQVKLTFEGLETLPQNFEAWLVDKELKISQNLGEPNPYIVHGLVENHPKRLKLVVGNHDFVLEKQIEFQTIPSSYELSQNFPNPFNPTTTIRYGLPKAERVILKVFNLLGEEIVTLANDEQQAAGYHVAIWDGRNKDGIIVTSGIYVYRLLTGSFSMTKKMALVK